MIWWFRIRRVSSLASSAFLALAMGTCDHQNQILRASLSTQEDDDVNRCLEQWLDLNECTAIPDPCFKQRAWDKPIVEREFNHLMQKQVDNYDKARLLAASIKHSGDWLYAIPISSCGLRLDDQAVRIAIGLRLGVDICQLHTCICGTLVDARDAHGLSCKRCPRRLT